MVAAECSPLAKVGGLADVVGSLPKQLVQLRQQVQIIMPYYKTIDAAKYKINKTDKTFFITFVKRREKIEIYQTNLPKSRIKVWLLKNQRFLSNGEIYLKTGPFLNQQRFTFFCLAVAKAWQRLDAKADLIHAHDWHTGWLIKLLRKEQPKLPVLYTIHNLSVQGEWPKKIASKYVNLENSSKKELKSNHFNPMRLAILYASAINTVSPSYAQEILTAKFSQGLKTELNLRKKDLYGIINGLDINHFNPQTDKVIYKRFSLKNLNDKNINKQQLQKELKFPVAKNIPLIGVVSRLYEQKGLDWLANIVPQLVNQNTQIVILGTGDKNLENRLNSLGKKHSKHLKTLIKFDTVLAQKIYAASDLFLIPSRFEPCGLTQMIAMRYGSVPIVRQTGGLKDTVPAYQKIKNKITGVGFVFKKENPQELYKTIVKALKVYNNKRDWAQLQKNCMRQDFSWQKSAKEYIKLYKKILNT